MDFEHLEKKNQDFAHLYTMIIVETELTFQEALGMTWNQVCLVSFGADNTNYFRTYRLRNFVK